MAIALQISVRNTILIRSAAILPLLQNLGSGMPFPNLAAEQRFWLFKFPLASWDCKDVVTYNLKASHKMEMGAADDVAEHMHSNHSHPSRVASHHIPHISRSFTFNVL